jgi:hypothetical protein
MVMKEMTTSDCRSDEVANCSGIEKSPLMNRGTGQLHSKFFFRYRLYISQLKEEKDDRISRRVSPPFW